MKCEGVKSNFSDYLTGEIKSTDKLLIQNHIKTCTPCRKELENLNRIWVGLGVLPEEQPSQHLRENFYTMLESYKDGLTHQKSKPGLWHTLTSFLEKLWPARPVYQFGVSFVVLLLGFWLGYLMPTGNGRGSEITQLRSEMDSMKQFVSVTLLKQQSPADRIQGITISTGLKNPGNSTFKNLLNILNSDSNVNVRLSAVDALYLFCDNRFVKKGLIDSLSQQTSPLVQIAIVDLLTEIREKKAVKALRKLIDNQDLNPQVKERIKSSILKLI